MRKIDFSKWKPENVRKFQYLSKVKKGARLYSTFGIGDKKYEIVEVVKQNVRLSGNRHIRVLVIKTPKGSLHTFNYFGNLVLNRFGATSPDEECDLFKDETLRW